MYKILQFTDEEVEQSYEEFYEDVHTEFLKFGELVNFKVLFSSFPTDYFDFNLLTNNLYLKYIKIVENHICYLYIIFFLLP